MLDSANETELLGEGGRPCAPANLDSSESLDGEVLADDRVENSSFLLPKPWDDGAPVEAVDSEDEGIVFNAG